MKFELRISEVEQLIEERVEFFENQLQKFYKAAEGTANAERAVINAEYGQPQRSLEQLARMHRTLDLIDRECVNIITKRVQLDETEIELLFQTNYK